MAYAASLDLIPARSTKSAAQTSGSGNSREDLDLAIDATLKFFKEKKLEEFYWI